MGSSENHFRTVAFGGFHKQDVLRYITLASKENQERTAGLQQKAEQVQQERDDLAEKLTAAEAARKKNAAECERLSAALTQRTTALEQAERELAELKAEHEKASARLAELEERLPHLEEDATAYAALKDRTATIELEAHRTAQATVEQAQEQADKIQGEMESWLRRVQNAYQHLRTDILATVTHLSGELERGKKTLEDAVPAFLQHDEALAALLACERGWEVKAPEPLPLDEKEEMDHV